MLREAVDGRGVRTEQVGPAFSLHRDTDELDPDSEMGGPKTATARKPASGASEQADLRGDALGQRLVPSCQPVLVNSVSGRSTRAPSMTISTRSLKNATRPITAPASLSGAS